MIGFAVRVLKVAEELPNTRIGNHISSQLIRSGTSPAPNYGEACAAESPKDFIHKMKIGLKELRETAVWMKMICRKPLIQPTDRLTPLIAECDELTSIFVTSIRTVRQNKAKK